MNAITVKWGIIVRAREKSGSNGPCGWRGGVKREEHDDCRGWRSEEWKKEEKVARV